MLFILHISCLCLKNLKIIEHFEYIVTLYRVFVTVQLLQHCWQMNDAENFRPSHRLSLISEDPHSKREILSPGGNVHSLSIANDIHLADNGQLISRPGAC